MKIIKTITNSHHEYFTLSEDDEGNYAITDSEGLIQQLKHVQLDVAMDILYRYAKE